MKFTYIFFHLASIDSWLDLTCIILLDGGGTVIAEQEGDLYGWLEEIEMPKESEMDGIEYLGPQINDTTSS